MCITHIFLLSIICVISHPVYEKETDALFWYRNSKVELKKRIDRRSQKNAIAKNAILLIGDGMGITTVTAGRIHEGQRLSKNGYLVDGESYQTAIDKFPIVGLAKTYSIDYQTTDSAASATAYLCGVKTRSGTLGVDGHCIRTNCQTCGKETYVESVLKRAHAEGKWTGIVTNTRVTHASPAGGYAHCPDRTWESFDGIHYNQTHYDQGCRDIAHQLVINASFLNVVFGGGLSMFLPSDNSSHHGPGIRIDSLDLIEEWLKIQGKQYEKSQYKFIHNMKDFESLRPPVTHVLGLFAPSHLDFSDKKRSKSMQQPSLASMTQKAIEILSHSPKGYVLFVEGGLIDVGHHMSQTGRALDEFINFDEAIERVVDFVDKSNTLIVISADHSHMFSVGANAYRNADVLGFTVNNKMNVSDIDNMPISIVGYVNGPGNINTQTRLSKEHWRDWALDRTSKIKSKRLKYESAIPLKSETHGGEDVPVYADGPSSDYLSGTYEQSLIADVIAYSTCLKPYNKSSRCKDD